MIFHDFGLSRFVSHKNVRRGKRDETKRNKTKRNNASDILESMAMCLIIKSVREKKIADTRIDLCEDELSVKTMIYVNLSPHQCIRLL